MIDNEELFKQIPKKISEWTQGDVVKWFQINDISIEADIKINGKQLLELTPTRIIKQFKLSNFLTRKISQWIQFETQDFNQYVQQNQVNLICDEAQTHGNGLQQRKNSDFYQKLKPFNENLVNYKSQQHFRNIPDELTKQKSQDSHSLSRQYQNDDTQIYKPLKYKAHKNSDKKKKFFQNSQNNSPYSKVKNVIQNKSNIKKGSLILNDLVQNSLQNNEDIQTFKYIPQRSQFYQLHKVQNNLKSNDNVCFSPQASESQTQSNHVKFVSSQLLLAYASVLTASVENSIFQITRTTRVGRSITNDIVLKSDGVSRSHAQIIVQKQMNQQNQLVPKYYVRDIGSRYGTFVQTDPQKPKKISQGKQYCIGQAGLRIQKVKIYKNKKFDLSLTIVRTQQQQKTFLNKSIITIGKKQSDFIAKQPKSSQVTKRSCNIKQRQKRDIQLEDNQIKSYHCRFVLINGEIYLQQVQGNILERIQKNQRYQFTRSQYIVKFGDQNVFFKLQAVYKPLSQNR